MKSEDILALFINFQLFSNKFMEQALLSIYYYFSLICNRFLEIYLCAISKNVGFGPTLLLPANGNKLINNVSNNTSVQIELPSSCKIRRRYGVEGAK